MYILTPFFYDIADIDVGPYVLALALAVLLACSSCSHFEIVATLKFCCYFEIVGLQLQSLLYCQALSTCVPSYVQSWVGLHI